MITITWINHFTHFQWENKHKINFNLFEDVAYDSNIAFEIFMDEDESFNIAERNKEGPRAPKFSILKTDDSESSDKKDEKNLNPDIHSRSSSFSTHILLFVGLIVCLKIIF